MRRLVIEDLELIDRRVKKSKGQLIRITIKNPIKTKMEKWLIMRGITSKTA
jgi:hypothetical protein